jgi:hypothetical protein
MTDRERIARETVIRDLGWLTPAERTHLAGPDGLDVAWLRRRIGWLDVRSWIGRSRWGFVAFLAYFMAIAGLYLGGLMREGVLDQGAVALGVLFVLFIVRYEVLRRLAAYRALLALADPSAPELDRSLHASA